MKLRYDCEEKPGTAIAGCPPIATLYKCWNIANTSSQLLLVVSLVVAVLSG